MTDSKRKFVNKICEVEVSKCQTTMPKLLPNQNMYCPWISTAPLSSPIGIRINEKDLPSDKRTVSQPPFRFHHGLLTTLNGNELQVNCDKMPCAAVQHSSNLFLHFLRLMQIFPEIHPATLHTTMVLCKNNFFCAVDKLLYARKYKTSNDDKNQNHQKVVNGEPYRHFQAPSNQPFNTQEQNAYSGVSIPKAAPVKTINIGTKSFRVYTSKGRVNNENKKFKAADEGRVAESSPGDLSFSPLQYKLPIASISSPSNCVDIN